MLSGLWMAYRGGCRARREAMKKLMAVAVMTMCGCLFVAKGTSEERIAALEENYEARVRDAQPVEK